MCRLNRQIGHRACAPTFGSVLMNWMPGQGEELDIEELIRQVREEHGRAK
jgi:hypothetical protein